MIREVTMYQAVCDGCGKPCAETGRIMAWANRESARIAAWQSGWLIVNHETYCPNCVEYDEETDEYKPKKERLIMEEKKLNLKPFDLEKAKAGKPVCTRDGRKARIICFDRISGDDVYKIVACVTAFDGDFEEVLSYRIDGYIVDSQNPKDEDLMMLPEKKEGWVNVYKNQIHDTPESAEGGHKGITDYIKTIRVEWEE